MDNFRMRMALDVIAIEDAAAESARKQRQYSATIKWDYDWISQGGLRNDSSNKAPSQPRRSRPSYRRGRVKVRHSPFLIDQGTLINNITRSHRPLTPPSRLRTQMTWTTSLEPECRITSCSSIQHAHCRGSETVSWERQLLHAHFPSRLSFPSFSPPTIGSF
ncbi:hypothetical protein DL95DRAFT_66798 [Leptodontidium sp. 2 PMI_412]|nr:hypothetical protein DL95DRAFT_66798 [Leptodontidium sp. 2 PMI_412]